MHMDTSSYQLEKVIFLSFLYKITKPDAVNILQHLQRQSPNDKVESYFKVQSAMPSGL